MMRCLALAQAWQDAGGRAAFAMAEATPAVEERLRNEDVNVVRLPVRVGTREDCDRTSTLAATHQAEWVVVDGYHFGGEYQLELKRGGHKVLFVDDNGHAENYSADLVMNQNAYATEDLYKNREGGTELLLGLPYAMLRREFRRWREKGRDELDVGSKVLVTLGGSDAANLTIRVIQALEQVGLATLDATIVAGGSNPHTRDLENAVAKAQINLHLVRNVTSMPELMARADIAVSAAGTTVLELAFMGIPTILVTVADNQRSNARACERLEIAVNLGDLVHLSPMQLAAAVRELIGDSERRTRMTQRARTLVDGLGAERIAARLMGGNRRGQHG
jgi:UDP-2,4-diacetamido-2,4,6-trideoxy-beta-L-altropyranose hydrolase